MCGCSFSTAPSALWDGSQLSSRVPPPNPQSFSVSLSLFSSTAGFCAGVVPISGCCSVTPLPLVPCVLQFCHCLAHTLPGYFLSRYNPQGPILKSSFKIVALHNSAPTTSAGGDCKPLPLSRARMRTGPFSLTWDRACLAQGRLFASKKSRGCIDRDQCSHLGGYVAHYYISPPRLNLLIFWGLPHPELPPRRSRYLLVPSSFQTVPTAVQLLS